jgi:hypothetical protein
MAEGERITGNTVFTTMDLLRAANRCSRLLPWAAASALGTICFAWLLVVSSEGTWFSSEQPWFTALTVICTGVTACGFVLHFGGVVLRNSQLSEDQKRLTFEIDSETIVVRNATGAASIIPWSVIRRFSESSAGFAIQLRPAGVCWLPKRSFNTDAIESLRRLARERLGGAAKVWA